MGRIDGRRLMAAAVGPLASSRVAFAAEMASFGTGVIRRWTPAPRSKTNEDGATLAYWKVGKGKGSSSGDLGKSGGPILNMAHDGLQGGANNWPIRAPSSLLPRARTL